MGALPPVTATSDSPGRTRALGAALAASLQPGDVVLLSGDLGAGKTVLVQGIAAGLGVDEPATSPTFALVHEHHGTDLRLLHADAWRLASPEEAVQLALAEEVDDGATALVVEWGELAADALPGDHLRVVLRPGPGEDDRTVELHLEGPSWEARRERLLVALPTAGGAG
jgi:tRNA threonylcarbamoyladenosine biosynthesis protein TsaE